MSTVNTKVSCETRYPWKLLKALSPEGKRRIFKWENKFIIFQGHTLQYSEPVHAITIAFWSGMGVISLEET